MDDETRNLIRDLQSTDDKVRLNALQAVLGLTDTKVDWAYEVWDEMIEKISHENSYQRSIGIMVLCNLAKSDHENRLGAVLDKLLAHTKDEKFITSRQCLQNIWKAGVMNEQNRAIVVEYLEKRYRECASEKHYNLLRLDIIQTIRRLSDEVGDPSLLKRAQALAAEEADAGYRKKFETALKVTL